MPPKNDAASAADTPAESAPVDRNTGGFASLSELSVGRSKLAAPAVSREEVRCFVSRGRSHKHDGKWYGQGRELFLPRHEFERLKRFGTVYEMNPLDAIVQAQPTPAAGSDSKEGPGVDKTANGASADSQSEPAPTPQQIIQAKAASGSAG